MDLLDDSGDEGNTGKMESEVDENLLLNSDDEEGGIKGQQSDQYNYDEEELLYEGDEDAYLGDETGDGDVLDLELGDEELETPESVAGSSDIAPVKFRAHEVAESPDTEQELKSTEEDRSVPEPDIDDKRTVDSPPSSVPTVKSTVDSDDDDESPRHRSRFLSERKTEDIPKSSGSMEGIPIQTLGERNQRSGHMLDSRRGGRGGPAGRGMRFAHRGMMHHNMRQKPPSLLGDRPRQPLLRFPGYGGQQMGHDNFRQLQGGFIDFSKPLHPPPKSPLKNVFPQPNQTESEKKAGAATAASNNSQNIPNPSQQSHHPSNPAVPNSSSNQQQPARNPNNPPHPRHIRPVRPQQQQQQQQHARMVRPRGLAGNPFMQGPPNSPVQIQGPPRPGMNPMRQQLRPPQFQPQWNQSGGPGGIPIVIPGQGGPVMNGAMEGREPPPPHQFNNFGPPGLMGPPPGNPHFGGPPNGFQNLRQPFPPPRFSPPEDMIHHRMPLQQHMPPAGGHHQNQPPPPPFMHNFPPVHHEMHPPPQHFPPMRPDMHRGPSPQMGPPQPQQQQQQQPPPQQQQQHPHPSRFGHPNQSEQNWPPPHHGEQAPFQHHHSPHPPQPHPPAQQQPKPKVNPFRINHLHDQQQQQQQHPPERSNPFYPDRYRSDAGSSQDDHYHGGSHGDRYRSENRPGEHHRESYYDSYDDRGRDYRDLDQDAYRSERSYDRSSHARPPLKRPSEYRDERLPEKRSSGSPEKRLSGRLGPPVTKYQDAEEVKRKEEALKYSQEAKMVIGLDDDYLRKLEEQKEMRNRILREKEERRKKQLMGQSDDADDSHRGDASSREVRIVKTSTSSRPPPQRPAIQSRPEARVEPDSSQNSTTTASSNVAAKKSIYINPRAFRGDLSALNTNLKGIGVNLKKSGTDGSQGFSREVPPNKVSMPTAAAAAPVRTGSEVPGSGMTVGVTKKRTILRIVRNKKGEIISKSKSYMQEPE